MCAGERVCVYMCVCVGEQPLVIGACPYTRPLTALGTSTEASGGSAMSVNAFAVPSSAARTAPSVPLHSAAVAKAASLCSSRAEEPKRDFNIASCTLRVSPRDRARRSTSAAEASRFCFNCAMRLRERSSVRNSTGRRIREKGTHRDAQ